MGVDKIGVNRISDTNIKVKIVVHYVMLRGLFTVSETQYTLGISYSEDKPYSEHQAHNMSKET